MHWLIIIACGIAGGGLFVWLRIPGGAMLGSVVAVMLATTAAHFKDIPMPAMPATVEDAVFIALGIVVGYTFRPAVLSTFLRHWPVVCTTIAILLASGCLAAFLMYKIGFLSPIGAYLATTPGGLNASVGLASEMDPAEAPIILMCQVLRLYTVLLTVPILGRLLTAWCNR